MVRRSLVSPEGLAKTTTMNKYLLILATVTMVASHEVKALSLRESLAMLETGAIQPQYGAPDRIRGNSGEVSRYQIMPDVWRRYSNSREYENPEVSWQVASKILSDRIEWFKKIEGREPSSMEIYLLWNKPGHFQATGFTASKVKKSYRERANRFANLMTLPSLAMLTR
jgi:hypothetical protein